MDCPLLRNYRTCSPPVLPVLRVRLDWRIPPIVHKDAEYGEDQADDQEGDDEYPEDGGHFHHTAKGAVAAVGILVVPDGVGGEGVDHAVVGLILVVVAQAGGSARRQAEQAQEWTEQQHQLTMIDS